MPHADTEDQLVEQPTIGLFAELGWITVSRWRKPSANPHPAWRPPSPIHVSLLTAAAKPNFT